MTDLLDHDLDAVTGGDALFPGDDYFPPDSPGYLPPRCGRFFPCPFPTDYWI